MEKRYDRAALIHAYIATRDRYYGHEDFKRFNDARLAALEQAFGLRLHRDGIKHSDNSGLWMLFTSTADSYLSIRTPGSDFLEAGLLMRHLDELGEQAKPLMADWDTIIAAAEASEKAHLRMLDELFKLLWGDVTTVVTSEQLRLIGFDDAQEPNWVDYE